MKYYKKENVKVETVEQYRITKMKCYHCNEFITEKDCEYCKVVSFPIYPELDVETEYIHKRCLHDYLDYLDKQEVYWKIEIEYDEFSQHTVKYINKLEDREDKDEK